MQGDLFYPVTETFWQPSDKFLVSSPSSLEAYEHLRPFQAFSSWAGMAVLSATPFLPPHNLRFRRGREGECAASECELVCRDLWELGFGRIQVVPSVQVSHIPFGTDRICWYEIGIQLILLLVGLFKRCCT